jgi:uncharacterized protein
MASLPFRVLTFAPALALAFFLLPATAAPTFPELTGRVVDNAELLSAADEQALTDELKALEDKSSDQLVVVTLPSLQGYEIEDYGYQLGRYWGIGTKKLNNGVLLIIAPNEHAVRIEVGYGLEPILTDALTRTIIESSILPRFRAGDYVGGIKDGVRDITLVLTGDAAEVADRGKGRDDADSPSIDWFTVVFWLLILSWIGWNMWWNARHHRSIFDQRGVGGSSSSSGWGGSWGGNGGFSGGSSGGFSGGGGSFGGGGASGHW